MTNTKLFLDIHVIQTLPPSNINRDDTGSPKTAHYGGVRRARVSSQAWKRAVREYFNEKGAASNVGVRTLEIVQYLAGKISQLDASIEQEAAMELADKTINAAGIKTKDQRAKALFFLGDSQADQLAQAALAGNNDKKELQAILKSNPAVDIALFGRMVADAPNLNEDASSQVAHAISTHGVQTEFDFYTAVDDLAPEDNAGAGMLGTLEFNSSTLYRYANVAVHDLLDQLGDEEATTKALSLYVESFANSMPTGKINSYANQTLPNLVLVTIRQDRPVNLVSAFENPVKNQDGYVLPSISRLLAEKTKSEKLVEKPVYQGLITTEDISDKKDIEESTSLADFLEDIKTNLDQLISRG